MELKFKKENLQGIYFFTENLNFPIAIASYSERETNHINYLNQSFQNLNYTSEELCKWCKHHHVQYQIIYPVQKICILKNPYKFYKFLELRAKIKRDSL